MDVGTFAARILRAMPQYIDFTREVAPSWLNDIGAEPDEKPLGIYENTSGSIDDVIVVTTKGLYIQHGGSWQAIEFQEILSVGISADKSDAHGLTAKLSNGRIFFIPVRGGRGPRRDAFEFLRFLDRVRTHFDELRRRGAQPVAVSGERDLRSPKRRADPAQEGAPEG